MVNIAANLKPFPRGELEITDVDEVYLERGQLSVEQLGRGFAWLDTGTHDSMVEATTFLRTLEKRQGQRIACPEEVAFLRGFITRHQLIRLGESVGKSPYGQYLIQVAREQ